MLKFFKVSVAIPLFVMYFIVSSSAATTSLDRNAYTIYYNNKPANKEGDYKYDFQTSNGITVKGAGNANGAVGVVQYVSPEGLPITWTYVADSEGYHPEGEHIPIRPEYVEKALEYIRTHPTVDEKKSRSL
ncbi:pupal cuticle protein Edg-78E isoform X2 [Stomoxys calcitrans]|uniref:pupal cuticle protein Edg-78E isoform X2 n=1 Tax=Stomoxys calcitrans TaxID=35570 RepID=UPI0027E2AD07|nr:pupal cuticle protein Edg-78E isoform X2 [Stomoxys calcitrans]